MGKTRIFSSGIEEMVIELAETMIPKKIESYENVKLMKHT